MIITEYTAHDVTGHEIHLYEESGMYYLPSNMGRFWLVGLLYLLTKFNINVDDEYILRYKLTAKYI